MRPAVEANAAPGGKINNCGPYGSVGGQVGGQDITRHGLGCYVQRVRIKYPQKARRAGSALLTNSSGCAASSASAVAGNSVHKPWASWSAMSRVPARSCMTNSPRW